MILIETLQICGFGPAIRGMRNSYNSWDKSDSKEGDFGFYDIGPKDWELMIKLTEKGGAHAKFRRMIVVYADILAPLYWWKEFDTYKVGTVANSCSTMHTIANKEFAPEDFSLDYFKNYDKGTAQDNWIIDVCAILNTLRTQYMNPEPFGTTKKNAWYQLIQFLPESYNQKRTVMLNYEVLSAIYDQRRGHKLDEWSDFRKWERTDLPYSKLITLGKG